MAVTLTGAQLSEAANTLAHMKASFFGRGPESTKAFLNDDLLAVVLRGGFLDVEEELIKRGRSDMVRELRLTWQAELDDEITRAIENVVGYGVHGYHSQVLVEPRLIVELFFLVEL